MKSREKNHPPNLPLQFFRWFCHPKMLDYIEGDLTEVYRRRVTQNGRRKADFRFIMDVLLLFRPGIIAPMENRNLNNFGMLQSYFKIGWRNLVNNKGYSFINIAGLGTGITVVLLITLWIWDEISWDSYFADRNRIAQVWQHNTLNGEVSTSKAMPWVTAEAIRNDFPSDFKFVIQSTWTETRTLTHGETILNKRGKFMEPLATEMLSLKMLNGTRDGLKDPYSILLSQSASKAFFGDTDPMNQVIRIGKTEVKVTGVFEDLPANTSFNDLEYLMSFELYVIRNPWMKEMSDPWTGNFSQTFVQLTDQAAMSAVSQKIKDLKKNRLGKDSDDLKQNPEVFLHPMSQWHLYSDFKDGKNAGGRIQFVWLFGSIGVFVLLLACINFMNLSTARSEKRAKEVGIRKSMGSQKSQLMTQFFSEAVLLSVMAFLFALLLSQWLLPFFNQVGGKHLSMPWGSFMFWVLSAAFCLFIGLMSGSYPALFLSSFQPVKVLKSSFRTGRGASIPRRVLVIFQFGISTVLAIGTIVVYQQVQFVKGRPTGYNRSGLLSLSMRNEEIHKHFDAVRNELIESGAILDMAESGSALTNVNNNNSGFDWKGKDPGLAVEFANTDVSVDYGKTIGWKMKSGRDFSLAFKSDSAAFIINEAAARLLNFKEPLGETLTWNGNPFQIIGVVEDVIMESPYEPVRPSLFFLTKEAGNVVFARLNPAGDFSEEVAKVEAAFKKHNPISPFEYQFVDQEYDKKFGDEERVGKLSGIFAGLAIFISCLGIFALASYMSEQRTKEIGVRKVMGASEINLWGLLSKDFMILVGVSLFLAIPLAYFSMSSWLQQYAYRTEISWWIPASAGAGTLAITLITVSYQSIKAARANPIKSLRSE